MKRRRAAITGIGLDTCRQRCRLYLGRLARRSQRRRDDHQFDASGFSTQIAAEVKGFDAASVIDDRKMLKFANRSWLCSGGSSRRFTMRACAPPATARRWALAAPA